MVQCLGLLLFDDIDSSDSWLLTPEFWLTVER
jgi:hypothetical protein